MCVYVDLMRYNSRSLADPLALFPPAGQGVVFKVEHVSFLKYLADGSERMILYGKE